MPQKSFSQDTFHSFYKKIVCSFLSPKFFSKLNCSKSLTHITQTNEELIDRE